MGITLVLNRSRQVAAEESPAFGHVAERFRRAGDLDRAVALCREGLQKFPSHVSARVTLGWALLDLGRYEEARVALEGVLKRAPDNLAAIRGLAQLHTHGEANEVEDVHPSAAWLPPASEPPAAAEVAEVDAPAPVAEAAAPDEFDLDLDPEREPDPEPVAELPPLRFEIEDMLDEPQPVRAGTFTAPTLDARGLTIAAALRRLLRSVSDRKLMAS